MAGGRKPGQTKWTEKVQEDLETSIRMGLSNKDACIVAGISEDTFIRWRDDNVKGVPVDFADRIARARAERTQLMLGHIRRAGMGQPALPEVRDTQGNVIRAAQPAIAPDWRAASDFLDRTAPDYRKPSKVELTGKDGGPVVMLHEGMPGDEYDFSGLSAREIFELDQALAKLESKRDDDSSAPLALPE